MTTQTTESPMMRAARMWNEQYGIAPRFREGCTPEELQQAQVLGRARAAAYWVQRSRFGDPAYGHMLDGSGGYEAFRNEDLDRVILALRDKPGYAEAAAILEAQCPTNASR